MRTTVDLDDDLLKELKAEARRQGSSLRETLNSLLRSGLRSIGRSAAEPKPYRCPSFSMGAPSPAISLDKALLLADALEDLEVARKLEMRK